ncbi:MAG: acetate--CoA ligase family protein [Thermodesulfovibrionales bacterium]|nr:acetate--CoA ligase family protein [Thermodesulfovibrionales bacterium]
MLGPLFDPASIAVFGASNDPKKVGHAVMSNLLGFGYRGRLYPVNPNSPEILGLKAYPTASAAGAGIDLAVIAIPARSVPDALLDCASAGVKAAVVISAGFKEAGPEGVRLEAEVRRIGREHGVRILGPNCLGIINTANGMNATFAAGMLPPGRTAFFSQSGALGIAILDWAIGNNIGFSKFISLGNKSDLSEIDFIEYFIEDPETDIILGYVEDVVDGRRFLDAAKRATKTKPVVILKSGGTAAGARAASSHTGALAGSEAAFNAAFKQTGVIRAADIEELFDTALAFSSGKLPEGDRLLIITNAGGPGIIAADAAERLGLRLPMMSKDSIDALLKSLPPNASLYNPVDIIGDATHERYASVLERAVSDPNVDGVVVILTPQAMIDVGMTAETVIHASKGTSKPVITSFMGEKRVREAIDRLKEASIYNFPYPERAVKAFKRLSDFKAWKDAAPERFRHYPADREAVRGIIQRHVDAGRLQMAEAEAVGVLSIYGFRFPQRMLSKTSKEAAEAASKLGFPVVMKISSPDILHKTDIGGVRLNIRTKREAEDAFTEITSNARRLMPDAFIEGVLLYEMVRPGKEVILGLTYDRTFGHMVMFGLGGIYVEVLKDVSFRIAPVSEKDAFAMVHEVKASALLKGARGERPVDIGLIVDGILRLSSMATDFPLIRELDINPLVVSEKEAVALDARIILGVANPAAGVTNPSEGGAAS